MIKVTVLVLGRQFYISFSLMAHSIFKIIKQQQFNNCFSLHETTFAYINIFVGFFQAFLFKINTYMLNGVHICYTVLCLA